MKKHIEYERAYRQRHPKKVRTYHKNYRAVHPLQLRIYRRRYRHNRRILTRSLTLHTIQRVYEDNIKKYGTLTCYLCLQSIAFGNDHLEHKIPLSRGGNNLYSNLAVACNKCNLKKGSKTTKEFKEE